VVPYRQTELTCRVAAKTGALIQDSRSFGFLLWVRRMMKRKALVVGMTLCMLAAWSAFLFLWDIRVEGNETVPDWKILAALAEENVKLGTFRLGLNQTKISNAVRQRVDGLSFLSVNIQGCKATVQVREETKMPTVYDSDEPVLLCAGQDGIVEEITVLNGKALCRVGNCVRAGEILVTGRLESEASPVRFVHAIGEIRARTVRTISAAMVTEGEREEETLSQTEKTSLIFGQNRGNLYFHTGISHGNCDKMIHREDVSLFGTKLPLTVEHTTVEQKSLSPSQWEKERAEDVLQEALLNRLQRLLGETGRVLQTSFVTEVQDDLVTVTLTAECSENIAEERRMTADEMTAKTY